MYLPNTANSSSASTEAGTFLPSSVTSNAPMSTPLNLTSATDGSESRRRELIDSRIKQELLSAENYIQYFILKYITVWTLHDVPVEPMPVDVAMLLLPKIKLYLEKETGLSKVQRLNVINSIVRQMKVNLPNTIQERERTVQMTSQYGVRQQLDNIDGVIHTLKYLLSYSDVTDPHTDVAGLDTSDIYSTKTVLAAAYVVRAQIDKLIRSA